MSRIATDHLVTSVVASRLYQAWGALEDGFELKPEKRAEALVLMRRAAAEWLVVKDDATARSAYLVHCRTSARGNGHGVR